MLKINSALKCGEYTTQRSVLMEYQYKVAELFGGEMREANIVDAETSNMDQHRIGLPLLDIYPLTLDIFNITAVSPIYLEGVFFDTAYDIETYPFYDNRYGTSNGADFINHDRRHSMAQIRVSNQVIRTIMDSNNPYKNLGLTPAKIVEGWQNNMQLLVDTGNKIEDPEVRQLYAALLFDCTHEDRWISVQESLPPEPQLILAHLKHKDKYGATRLKKLQLAMTKGIFGHTYARLMPWPENVTLHVFCTEIDASQLPDCVKLNEAQESLFNALNGCGKRFIKEITLPELKKHVWKTDGDYEFSDLNEVGLNRVIDFSPYPKLTELQRAGKKSEHP